jgi:hypothetical protein
MIIAAIRDFANSAHGEHLILLHDNIVNIDHTSLFNLLETFKTDDTMELAMLDYNYIMTKNFAQKFIASDHTILLNVGDNIASFGNVNKINNVVQTDSTMLTLFDPNYINKYNIDGYKFYSKMDSYGNDIRHYHYDDISNIKNVCDENSSAVGFNTLGWIKHTIVSEENLISLYLSTKDSDGLYIKE